MVSAWFRTLFSVSENDRVWALVCLAVFLPPWSVVRLENIRFLLLSCSVLSQSAYVLSFSCECRSVSACHICIVQVAYMYMYVHCSEAWRDDRNLHLYLARRQRLVLMYTAHPQLLILAEVKKSARYIRTFTVILFNVRPYQIINYIYHFMTILDGYPFRPRSVERNLSTCAIFNRLSEVTCF